MLQKIVPGTVYWKMLRENPAQTHLEIIFNLQEFLEIGSIDRAQPFHAFDPRERFYSLSDRNNYIKERKKGKKGGEEPTSNMMPQEENFEEIFNDDVVNDELNHIDDIHQRLFNA